MLNHIINNDVEEIFNSNIDWLVFMNKTVVITGSNGFIGSYLCRIFFEVNKKINLNISIICLVRDSSDLKNIDFLKDCNFSKIIRCDICNPKEIFLTKVDYIIHAASNASMKNISKRDSVFKLNCKLKVMDNFRKDNKHCVDFIKIDTEGSELLLLNGEKKILSEDKPIIFSEILRKWAKEFDYKANDILIFLRNYGYNCYKIRQTKLIAISKIDKKTIATNFIFLHSIKHKKEIKNFT